MLSNWGDLCYIGIGLPSSVYLPHPLTTTSSSFSLHEGITGLSAVNEDMELISLPIPSLYYGVPVDSGGAGVAATSAG